MELFQYILFFILLVYIGVLHYLLMKKNLFIEDIVKKLTDIERNWNKNEVIRFLKKLEKSSADYLVKEDKIMHPDILGFLYENGENLKSFVHYTAERKVVNKILNEGFLFSGSFHKTAEPLIPNDKVTLSYKHNLSRYFGKYIIIIAIDRNNYEDFERKIKEFGLGNYPVEQFLTDPISASDPAEDELYLFPRQFVKGYVNYETAEVFHNDQFYPAYIPPAFQDNIRKLSGGKN